MTNRTIYGRLLFTAQHTECHQLVESTDGCHEICATYQVDEQEKKRIPPDERHYKSEMSDYFKKGTVFRVWIDDNATINLGTFVVGKNKGAHGSCFKINHVKQDEKIANFERHHREVLQAKDGPTTRSQARADLSDCRPMEIIMPMNQNMRESCWIDLERSWDLQCSKYMVVNCGWLSEESSKRLWVSHLALLAA